MSIQTILNSISNIDREIHNYQQQINTINNNINNNTKEATRIWEAINREKNFNRVITLQKDLNRKKDDISKLEKDRSTKEKCLSDKQKRKYDLQHQLSKEEQKEREKVKKEQEELLSIQQKISREMEKQKQNSLNSLTAMKYKNINKTYDVFVSHASEDKIEFVRPFVQSLINEGLSVWYDEVELSIGMSLRRNIESGLKNSRYGIVVLSEYFFKKEWPQKELDGLFAREVNGEKVILPIWHKISKNEVLSYSPFIADLLALNTSNFTIAELAKEIGKVVLKKQY